MSATGSFIWYELMTSDATAAAKFYGMVVGWEIADHADPQSGMDYRMIGRGDGGYNGGVLALTADMVEHGARPTWLGYLHVADVDGAVKAIVADGGRLLMPRKDLPVGAIAMVADPMGTPFYVMAPIPPRESPTRRATFLMSPPRSTCAGTNSRALTSRAQSGSMRSTSASNSRTACRWARWAVMTSSITAAYASAIMQKAPQNPNAAWLFYFGVQSVTAAKAAIEKGGGKVMNGPHQVPGGDWVVIAVDPQGAVFGVVGPQGA